MAIGIYFAPAAASAEEYDECIKLLRKAGAGNPSGRSYHASFGPEGQTDGVQVWTLQGRSTNSGRL